MEAALDAPALAGLAASFNERAAAAAVVGLAKRCLDADFSGHAGDEEVRYAAGTQLGVQRRAVERALARFVQNQLARDGSHFRHNRIARFSSNQESATLDLSIEHLTDSLATALLGRDQVREVWSVRFQRMHHEQACAPSSMQHRSSGWKCCSQRRNLVPEGVAEATHVQKVALPVNHEQGHTSLQRDGEWVGLSLLDAHGVVGNYARRAK